jgi:hypothetical protein
MNNHGTSKTAMLLVAALLGTALSRADSKLFISMYGGWNMTQSGSIEGEAIDYTYAGYVFIVPVYSAGDADAVNYDYKDDSGLLAGIRGGTWLSGTRKDWAVAGDLCYFEIDLKPHGGSIKLSPFSFLLLYRTPLLVSEDFASGRLQPYAGVGLVMVLGQISLPGVPTINDAAGPGGSLHAGCTWMINPSLGLFLEYRYLTAKLYGMNDSEVNREASATEVDVDTVISTHQILSGISVFF